MKNRRFSKQLEKLGAKIRKLRGARGFSQETFANVCGLDRTYIGGIERCERNLGFRNLLVISQALKVNPSELLHGIRPEAED